VGVTAGEDGDGEEDEEGAAVRVGDAVVEAVAAGGEGAGELGLADHPEGGDAEDEEAGEGDEEAGAQEDAQEGEEGGEGEGEEEGAEQGRPVAIIDHPPGEDRALHLRSARARARQPQ